MRSEPVLALCALLALGTGVWLATTQGSRPDAEARAPGEPTPSSPTAVAGDELAKLPLSPATAQREESQVDPSVSPAEALTGKATLALRLVARETKEPVPDVSVLVSCEWIPGPRRNGFDRSDFARPEMSGAHEVFWSEGREPDRVPALRNAPIPRSDRDGRLESEVCAGHPHEIVIDPAGATHVRAEPIRAWPLLRDQRREIVVELATQDDLRWFGRVIDAETEQPLAGALVEWRERWPFGAPPVAASGQDGFLSLACASWKEGLVRIAREGYCTVDVVVMAGHESPDQAQLVRLSRPARVDVRVRAGDGGPVGDAALELRFEPPSADPNARVRPIELENRSRHADADGACAFEELTPGVGLQVIARRSGEPTQRQALVLSSGESREVVFEFGGGCRLQGRAQDAEGAPLSALDLWRLASQDGDVPGYLDATHESAVVDKVRTDAEGRFAFAKVPAGEWWIGAAPYERRGVARVPLSARVVLSPGERVRELTLTAPPAAFVRGRVTSELGHQSGATVTASRDGVLVRAQADPQGNFAVGPLPEGEWSLEASPADGDAPGEVFVNGARVFVPRERDVPPPLIAASRRVQVYAGDSDVELVLRPGGGLCGLVLDPAGAPAVGARVEARSEEDGSLHAAETGADGGFDFPGLVAGRYAVRARAGELVSPAEAERVALGRWTARLELRLRRSGAR